MEKILPDIEHYSQAVGLARELYDDLTFQAVRSWKEGAPTRRVIGFLPIYVPREIIHAAGMLPVGVFGGGDHLAVIRGDACFQSYICHLPRSVIELALNGNLETFDGFIFPSICDVIRNLSGVFKLQFKNSYIRYLDYPQNFDPAVGGRFYHRELEELLKDLQKLNGKRVGKRDLNRSIAVFNLNRSLVSTLSVFRSEHPHMISAVEYYLLLRAGYVLPVEEHNSFLEKVLELLAGVQAGAEDKIRVVLTGAFCEQPPLGLIQTIENAGCYIVEDDFQLGLKWFRKPVTEDSSDPLGALVEAYLTATVPSSAVYEGQHPRGEFLAQQVQEQRADGVLFCAPSFCDPALLDRPQLERTLDNHQIRHFSFQYHENLGQFHVIKEQAGTFADLIKLWE